MKSTRLTVAIGLVVCLAVVVGGLCRDKLTESSEENPLRHFRLVKQPDKAIDVAIKRVIAKRKVIRRLVAREITLLEAAAWFRHLNDNPAQYPSHFRSHFLGASDGEKAARQVILWVQTQLSHTTPKSEADAIVARLKNELNELLARDPLIELPW